MQAGLKLSGRYVLEALLGYGGMGEVWRGVDEHLGRQVAVKVLREHFADPELTERFRHEARIAARLQHPGITVVHDVGSDNGHLFIVMELLHGRDLASMLAEAPSGLSIDAAVSLALQATEALQAAHAGHVIHRDLKPANLFMLSNGHLKICDFGIARAVDAASHLTATGQAIGTPAYMSPEQCLGQQVDERSDLYSLGYVFYALLTGQPPFVEGQPLAIMSQHLNAAPLAPRTIRADIPPELDHLVLDMLAKDPARRPADAGHVIAALRQWRYTPTIQVEPIAKASFRLNLDLPTPAEDISDFQSMDPDRTMTATLSRLSNALPSHSAAITQVPRTEAERQQVLLALPVCWEFLHFAGQLLHERDSVEAKYRDHELRYAPMSGEVVVDGVTVNYIEHLDDAKTILQYINRRFNDAMSLARKMSDLFNDEAARERAFGAPGEKGDPERLTHLATRLNNVYEQFLDLAAGLRGASVPPKFQKLLELAARFTDSPVKEYRRFVDEYVAQANMLLEDYAAGRPLCIEAHLVLSVSGEVINDYQAELKRECRRPGTCQPLVRPNPSTTGKPVGFPQATVQVGENSVCRTTNLGPLNTTVLRHILPPAGDLEGDGLIDRMRLIIDESPNLPRESIVTVKFDVCVLLESPAFLATSPRRNDGSITPQFHYKGAITSYESLNTLDNISILIKYKTIGVRLECHVCGQISYHGYSSSPYELYGRHLKSRGRVSNPAGATPERGWSSRASVRAPLFRPCSG